jgi:hypothetical protein
MHQSVVEYEATHTAMLAVPQAVARRAVPCGSLLALRNARPASGPDLPAPADHAGGEGTKVSSYIAAATIAASLVAAWAGLCII